MSQKQLDQEANSENNKIIQVNQLVKQYEGGVTAVDNISFQVDEGEIFAFLGPNGAGKSTAIKILTTVSRPTSGEILVNGYNTAKEEHRVRDAMGVVFQDHTLDKELTAYENLYYHTVLYGVPKNERKDRIQTMLDNVGLWERRNSLVKTFSGGMKRRVEIVRALLHYPKILILDEPTSGLDAQTRFFLWNHIDEINRDYNITVFLTTHNLEEAEKVAENIAIIDQGQILAMGSSKEIKAQTETESLERAFLEITGYDLRY
ncbi:ABC transporter ATP-binding protein [Natranaerobius thermophilus]|uniref:ABC transporter related n=1 Tax=Natranaerobius thermophilus (strain ATCC BAA-1301 / DSM 18059 / JW/NM-WN-LF) TaxID=457570 RepID=B2A8C6_NATTJ|nr:ATP-binding cassette domain-containing protein [Natranaerobius thermophilus]ACB84492.1 ABC transporter related [Natranaerobius thermophilus JW/NM-WN-LF]